MALIKSKQLQDVAATKVVETTEKRFTSDTEKAAFADKYTKAEADTSISTALTTAQGYADTAEADAIATAAADAEAKATAAEAAAIAAAATDAATKAGAAETAAKAYADSIQTTLSSQITNAIAGLTWKTPVATFADIVTAYPTPEEGWMVTIADTNKVFRYDLATTSWVEFPITAPQTYSKTIAVTVLDNATTISTGIKNDGTGAYFSSFTEITLAINGFIQQAGAGKDYTVAFVANELVVTWTDRSFVLEATDEITITFTQIG